MAKKKTDKKKVNGKNATHRLEAMQKAALKELQMLVDARYPLIYVVSHEENRVIELINTLCEEEKNEKVLSIWAISQGLYGFREMGRFTSDDETTPPPGVLTKILKRTKNDIPALFVLLDFHVYMENATVVRMLRDCASLLMNRNCSVIIIAPELKVPRELEKVIQVIDWPLPAPDEMRAIVEGLAKSNAKNTRVDLKDTDFVDGILGSLQGLTYDEAENILSKSLIKKKTYDINVITSEKQQIIRKGGFLEYYSADFTMNDLGGVGILKEWIHVRKSFFTKKAQEFGIPFPKGMLLIGIPGCGKSLACKIMANAWQMPLLKFDIGKVFQSLIGSSEGNIRSVVKLAEAIAPCVLWLDEVDKSFQGIKSSGMTDSGVTARVFGTLITWLQEKTSPVFVAMTANDVTQLTSTIPEITRKGRLDEIFFINLPNHTEREQIFKIHLAKARELHAGRDPSKFDIRLLAQKAKQLSGAEIEGAVVNGLGLAFTEGKKLTMEHLLNGIADTQPIIRTAAPQMKQLIQFAEDGRAKWASKQDDDDSDIGPGKRIVGYD